MTLQQTDFLANKSETFQALRYLTQDLPYLRPGIARAGNYRVSAHVPSNMTVDVAAGSAWIVGGAVTNQGIYHQVNDGPVNVGGFANSHATLDRLDQLILVVNDSASIGTSDNPGFVLVQGANVTADPNLLDTRAGAVADATLNSTYFNWIRLADIRIPAASGSIVDTNIRQRKPWGRSYMIYDFVNQATGFNIEDLDGEADQGYLLHMIGRISGPSTVLVRPNNDAGSGYNGMFTSVAKDSAGVVTSNFGGLGDTGLRIVDTPGGGGANFVASAMLYPRSQAGGYGRVWEASFSNKVEVTTGISTSQRIQNYWNPTAFGSPLYMLTLAWTGGATLTGRLKVTKL